MKMPGFSAEASLYKAGHYCQVEASTASRVSGRVVVPQVYHPLFMQEVCWWVWDNFTATLYCGGRKVTSHFFGPAH
jgi:hypothetical protein